MDALSAIAVLLMMITFISIPLSAIFKNVFLFFIKDKTKRFRTFGPIFYWALTLFLFSFALFMDEKPEKQEMAKGPFVLGVIFLIIAILVYKTKSKKIDTNTVLHSSNSLTEQTHIDLPQEKNELPLQAAQVTTPSKKSLGFFERRRVQKELKEKAIKLAVTGNTGEFFRVIDTIPDVTEKITSSSQVVARLLPKIIDDAVSDSYLSETEESSIYEILKHYNIVQGLSNEYKTTLVLNSISRRILEGAPLTPYRNTEGFMLQKNELPIYSFDVYQYAFKSRRVYHAGNSGVSLKVMKGMYVRVGKTRGYSENIEELESQGYGSLLVTNKRIMFSSDNGIQAIKLEKIIGIEISDKMIHISLESSSTKGKAIHFKAKADELRFIGMFISNADSVSFIQ